MLLRIEGLDASYGDIAALRGVSLSIEQGEVVSLLGSNGSGKSTLLRCLSGLIPIKKGKISFGEMDNIVGLPPSQIVNLGLIQVPEGGRIFPYMTVWENLLMGASGQKEAWKVRSHSLERVLNLFPIIKERKSNQARLLSGGERQMLVIGRAMMARPKLMMLDEPSLGLAPLLIEEIYAIIERFNSEQKTSVLLVEQNVRVALGIAHYGYVMENGRIVLDGTADFLQNNEDVKEFYLGLSAMGTKKIYREVKHYKRRKRWL